MMGEGGGDSSLAGVVQATCVLKNIGNQINDEISDQHSAGPITCKRLKGLLFYSAKKNFNKNNVFDS